MLTRIISPILILSPRKLVPIIFILSGLVSNCGIVPLSTPNVGIDEPPQTAVADVFTPTPQVLESTSVETTVTDTTELFSNDQLGLCFSYPQGYTLNPDSDTVQIAAPILPDTDVFGLFWLEISDAYDRTAEQIADQDMTYAAGLIRRLHGMGIVLLAIRQV